MIPFVNLINLSSVGKFIHSLKLGCIKGRGPDWIRTAQIFKLQYIAKMNAVVEKMKLITRAGSKNDRLGRTVFEPFSD
jgi:hypothetical protein